MKYCQTVVSQARLSLSLARETSQTGLDWDNQLGNFCVGGTSLTMCKLTAMTIYSFLDLLLLAFSFKCHSLGHISVNF